MDETSLKGWMGEGVFVCLLVDVSIFYQQGVYL